MAIKKFELLADLLTEYRIIALNPEQVASKLKDEILTKHPTAQGIVVYADMELFTPHFGEYTCVPIGADCTLKKVEDAEGTWVRKLEHSYQYPIGYVLI